jgi:hypothetical protein
MVEFLTETVYAHILLAMVSPAAIDFAFVWLP